MSVLGEPAATRQFEGPGILFGEQLSADLVFSRQQKLGNMALSDILTSMYGEEGVGWDATNRQVWIQESSIRCRYFTKDYDVLIYPDGLLKREATHGVETWPQYGEE